MTTLAKRVYIVRRQLMARWSSLVLLLVWPLLVFGWFSGAAFSPGGSGGWGAGLVQLSVLAIMGATLLWTVVAEVGAAKAAPADSAMVDFERGVLLMTSVYVLVAATGGPKSFLYPLVYALVSFLTIVHRRRLVAVSLLVVTLVLELAVGWSHASERGFSLFFYHATFIGFFAAGNLLVLSSLVRRLRRDHRQRVDEALARMRQEARDFRLIASALPPQSRSRSRTEEEARMAHAAVESIHEQLFHALELLQVSLGLHSAVLLWCERPATAEGRTGKEGPRLVVKEIASRSDVIYEDPALPSPGILTSIVAEPKPLRLKALHGKRIPPYYQGPEPVTDLCAVPLVEHGELRGILCGDRTGDRPFSHDEEQTLAKAAAHILRVIAHERVFTAVERSKYEQEQFYRASELLNAALTLEEVYEKSFAAVRAIARFDLAVISGTEGDGTEHHVLAIDAVKSDDPGNPWVAVADKLRELRWNDASSLVSMAVKNRHFMPASSEILDPDTVVFNPRTRLRAAKSILVLPLVRGDQVLGAITLADSRPNQYPPQTREMLRVIGHQVGVSLQNARMYQQMEQRATTDGLTGLTNHRSFQERLCQLHALAERTGQKYSVILTDIDKFKGINDTYGHPVGDQVLRRVAAIFSGRARKVDIVARYGGEEFVLVLPDTDAEGAEHFANKLREEIAEQVMTSEQGSFKVTISMGIAGFPADGRERMELIEKADQALYFCKEHGRNCVRRWAATR